MIKYLLILLLLVGCKTVKDVTVTLDGSNSKGDIVIYSWRQVQGITTAINKPNDAKTSVKVSKAGIYKYELVVFDKNGLTDSDTVMITVR